MVGKNELCLPGCTEPTAWTLGRGKGAGPSRESLVGFAVSTFLIWFVVSKFQTFFVFPYIWEESPQLTNIFQRGWNHQPVMVYATKNQHEWTEVQHIKLVGGLEHFLRFHNIWDNHPNWRTHIFQRGWNHQPVNILQYVVVFLSLFLHYPQVGWSGYHQLLRTQNIESLRGTRGTLAGFLASQWNKDIIWLVVWNMAFIFPYIGNNHPNWLLYFQRGRYTTNQ